MCKKVITVGDYGEGEAEDTVEEVTEREVKHEHCGAGPETFILDSVSAVRLD